jgi:hypothetical protein
MTRLYRALLIVLTSTLLACRGDAPELVVAQPDFPTFEAQVYPVLLRDCSFIACHGSSERFFQVYGPGRARLNPMAMELDDVTMEEIIQTYNRALSMIDVNEPAQSLLLRKPLALSVGGAGHEGVDSWMRDVYVSRQDPNYLILEAWVLAASAPAPAPSQGAMP